MALAATTPGSARSRSTPSRTICSTPADFRNRGPVSDIRIVSTLCGVEAGIDPPERDRRADEQRRPDEQDQRERDLDDDEDRPRLVLAEPGARPAGAFLQGGG